MSCIQLRDAPRGTCGPSNRLRITQVHFNSFFICGHSLQDWLQGSQRLHTGAGSNSSVYSVGWGEQHIFILLSEVGNNTAIHNRYDYRPCGCVLFHVSFRFRSSQRSCLYSTLHLSENRINQPVCVFTVCRGSVLKVKNRNTHHHYKNHVSQNITCRETGYFTCHERGFCVFWSVSVFWTSGPLYFFGDFPARHPHQMLSYRLSNMSPDNINMIWNLDDYIRIFPSWTTATNERSVPEQLTVLPSDGKRSSPCG